MGSPNLITDKNGVLKNRSKNLPFGERLLLPTANTPKSTRRFTNHEDQDGSAIYMQARTYLPAYGKFSQVDPAYDQTKDDPESWNLYNYITNNPVTHTDPDGREADTGAPPPSKFDDFFNQASAEFQAMLDLTRGGGELPRWRSKSEEYLGDVPLENQCSRHSDGRRNTGSTCDQ